MLNTRLSKSRVAHLRLSSIFSGDRAPAKCAANVWLALTPVKTAESESSSQLSRFFDVNSE